MASISSLMGSSSTSSIYGNSNIISGLASGMDTEAMIENAVSGIKTKIEGFNKDRAKLEWEQEAYRSIIDKLASFSEKYTSYTSNTNLLSTAFFDSATKVSTTGTNMNKVSATGKSDSDIQITAVQMATKATCYGGKITKTDGTDATASTKLSEIGFASGGSFKIGDVEITFTADETLSSLASKISKQTGVDATFSDTTGAFYLKSKETGDGQTIAFSGDSATINALFGQNQEKKDADGNTVTDAEGNAVLERVGPAVTDGKDAKVSMVVNGQTIIGKTYAKNQITVDGMTINLKESFGTVDNPNAADAVSFSTSVDADKIVNAVKAMVEDYNTMANEIKEAYSTKPLTNSKGERYEPLTEEEARDMSETAVEKYEKKAKTGLLFADSDLSALYNEMRSAINALGFTDIGLTTEYEDGKTTLKLDEDKLRSTLEADPDKVVSAFTKSVENGDNEDGGMKRLQATLEKYAKTTGTKGILVKLAGTTKSAMSLTDNDYKNKLDDIDETIERWQEKLEDKIDYYNRQFTRLEQMISDMNTQSSALSGLMGY